MKLRYRGGNTETVQEWVGKGQPKNITQEVQKDQLTIMFEGTEYHWPKAGSVLSLPSNIGGVLRTRSKGFLEELADDPSSERGAPRRMVAVNPEEAKPVAPPKPPSADPQPQKAR